jgi:hypothetical protein
VRLRLEPGHHERLIQRAGGWQRSPVKGSGSFSRRVVGLVDERRHDGSIGRGRVLMAVWRHGKPDAHFAHSIRAD